MTDTIPSPDRPRNVLLILTDQQRFDTLGCNGSAVARTPNVDRLAATGLNFQNHFVANPVCGPSRASIMTGKHITEHGLWANGCRLPAHQQTLPQVMAGHGFHTAHFGKFHLEPIIPRIRPHAPYGFDVCEVAEGDQQLIDDDYFRWLRTQHPDLFVAYLDEMYSKGHANAYTSIMPEEHHLSTWVTGRANDWLRHRRPADKPFLLSVGYFDPHHAFNPCEPYASAFADADVPQPRFDEAALDAKPAQYRQRFKTVRGTTRDAEKMTAVSRAYHAMCAHLDKCVGDLLTTLEEQGLAEDTVVIFSSDHGELLGEQGLLWKGPFLLDDLLRVPLIVNVPGAPLRPEGGETVTSLTSAVDLLASVQAGGGVSTDRITRASGRPMFDHDFNLHPDGERDHVLAEWEAPNDGSSSSLRCIRTATHKLVHYNRSDEGELYDLHDDPGEMHNCYDAPGSAAVRDGLFSQLSDHYLSRCPDTRCEGGW